MKKRKDMFSEHFPGAVYSSEEYIGDEKYLVFKIPAYLPQREFIPFIKKIWSGAGARKRKDNTYFAIDPDYMETQMKREEYNKKKAVKKSKNKKPKRTQRSKEVHQWIFKTFKELKKVRPRISKKDASDLIYERLSDKIREDLIQHKPTFPLLSTARIRTILSK